MNNIGIRSEEKHWESRVSISPDDIKRLPPRMTVYLQNDGERELPFKRRVFSNEEYSEAGKAGEANVVATDSLMNCPVIIGTKEIKEVFIKVEGGVETYFREYTQKIEKKISHFVFDVKLRVIALTDFISTQEKQSLLSITQDTVAGKAIQTLLTKQENLIEKGKTYLFFSHTHKGQSHNMLMLHEFIRKKSTLLDFELLKKNFNDTKKRTVSYGKWAGIIGILDTLWAYGEHLHLKEGIDNPFRKIRSPECYNSEQFEYTCIAKLQTAVMEIGKEIRKNGLMLPVKLGISGFRGEVGHGIIDILESWGLPTVEVPVNEFVNGSWNENAPLSTKQIYIIKLDYQHLYRPKVGMEVSKEQIKTLIKTGKGHLLESNLDKFFPTLSIFVNCIVWNKECPRLLTNAYLKMVYDAVKSTGTQILPVIGDITCDPNGSIECCRETYPNQPVYMWIPEHSEEPILPHFDLKAVHDDFKYFDFSKYGFVLMTVNNLPCEIPRDASLYFSRNLCETREELGGKSYVECLAEADFSKDFDNCGLPEALKDAVILYKGRFNSFNSQIKFKDVCLSLLDTEAIKVQAVLPMLNKN